MNILKNFIIFEGLDGAGTTTQIEILKQKFENKNFYFTFEPSNNECGKFLRKVLHGDIKLLPNTIAKLFAADRNEHLFAKDGIINKLKTDIVICDRYIFSNLAYQGPDCGFENVLDLNKTFPLPEYIFYFDIKPEISLERIGKRNSFDIYEKIDFLTQTYKEYEKILDFYSSSNIKIIRIDATLPIKEVTEKILNIIENLPIKET